MATGRGEQQALHAPDGPAHGAGPVGVTAQAGVMSPEVAERAVSSRRETSCQLTTFHQALT